MQLGFKTKSQLVAVLCFLGVLQLTKAQFDYQQSPYGQPPYGQPPHGQPPYGQPPHGQPPYEQQDSRYPENSLYPQNQPNSDHPQQFQQQNEPKIILDFNSRNPPHKEAVVAVDESLIILCQTRGNLDYCRFEIQNAAGKNILVLKKDSPSNYPNFEYYGTGLETGQCGLKIKSIQDQYSGNYTCTAFGGSGTDELSGVVTLQVAKQPMEPMIEQIGTPKRNGFEVNEKAIWKCIVRDGRPAARIEWYIRDGEQYMPINSMNPRHQIEVTPNTENQLFTSEQFLERMIQPEDDGKFLVCRSIHPQTRSQREAAVQLLVRYPPTGQRETDIYGLQLERSNTISITIKSNPRPRIEWKIDGDTIREREKNNQFTVPELVQVGPNLYNASLTIAQLTAEDLTKTFYLYAGNEAGNSEFIVRISSADTPSEGLEIGAIVGIIVVLAIIFVAIMLVVFARVTGKWCFAPKNSKTGAGEKNTDIDVEGEANESPLIRGQTTIQNNQNDVSKQSIVSNFCCCFAKRNNRDNTKYELTPNNEFFDAQNNVYNPTTVPIDRNNRTDKNDHCESPPIRRKLGKKNSNRSPSYNAAVRKSEKLDLADDVEIFTNENAKENPLLNELNNRLKNKNIYVENQPDIVTTATENNNSSQNNNSAQYSSRDSKAELLQHGNELGIPLNDSNNESRCSKWIPKNQRDLIEKQARILATGTKIPPPVPEKPHNKPKIINHNRSNENLSNETAQLKENENNSKPFETSI